MGVLSNSTARILSFFLIAFAMNMGSASARSLHSLILDGTDTSEGEFSEVFAITYSGDGATGSKILCTATLVHPRVLVTAAHCLPDNPQAPVTVIAGPDASAPTATYISSFTRRNKTYFSTQDEIQQTGFDIGIVVLANPIAGVNAATGAGLTRLASISETTDRNAAFDKGILVSGYGGKNSTSTDRSTGVKRWAKTRVLEATSYLFSTDGPASSLSHGDSGGPAYVLDPDGGRRLIGIASGVDKNRTLSGRALVSLYVGMRPELACWIEENSGIPLPDLPGSIGCNTKFAPGSASPFGSR